MHLRFIRSAPAAQHQISPGLGIQHEGEILTPHGGFRHGQYARFTLHRARGLRGQMHAFHFIDRRRIGAGEIGGGSRPHRGGNAGHGFLEAAFQQIPNLGREPARSAQHAHGLRDHVEGMPAGDMADGDHARFHRFHIARDDGLQRLHNGCCHHNRVRAIMRHGAMRAFPSDIHFKIRDRRHHRAFAPQESAFRRAWPIMHAENAFHRETCEQPFLHHQFAARQVFFRRLENHINGAIEIAGLSQILRSAKQHGGMPIMAAGMHFPRNFGGIRQAGFFQDRQRINIGAQPNRTTIINAPADHAHNAGLGNAGHHLITTKLTQLFGDDAGSAYLLQPQFRVFMKIPPPGGHFRVEFSDAVDDRHGDLPGCLLRYVVLKCRV